MNKIRQILHDIEYSKAVTKVKHRPDLEINPLCAKYFKGN